MVPGLYMFHGRSYPLLTLLVVTLLAPPAFGQSVISTHSGIVHFFQGAVFVNDQPLESHPGRFSSIPQGGELRTAEGRAEVLLTPGCIVRIGERSTIRLVANALSNTRVELLAGSATIDSEEPGSGKSVTLLYKNWSVRFPEQGVYRIDSNPPRLWVMQGEAEVSAGNSEPALLVKQGMDLPFAPVLVPEPSVDRPQDALSAWATGRQQSISADNAIAANIQDPASISPTSASLGTFTYYPMLGLPSSGPGLSSTYGYVDTYQPGFNSIYLPGYTHLPLLVGLYPGGYSTGFRTPHSGGLPVLGPHAPIAHPIGVSPMSSHPIGVSPLSSQPIHQPTYSPHPSPVHPASGIGGHIGAHR